MSSSAAWTVFSVNSEPYCLWGWDLRAQNLAFVRGIDADYFTYQAQTHRAQLDGDACQIAAVALRSTYQHGLETLFSLIGAATEAPWCVAAWIINCSAKDLNSFVENVQKGRAYPNELDRGTVSWSSLAPKLLPVAGDDTAAIESMHDGFATLWCRFAEDFLHRLNREEHNSFKDGFRIEPVAGTFTSRQLLPQANRPPPALYPSVATTPSEVGFSGWCRSRAHLPASETLTFALNIKF